jgi:hypothetical protein
MMGTERRALDLDSQQKEQTFLFSIASRQTALDPVSTWAVPRGLKRQGCKIDYTPPSSDDVKNKHIYTPTPICLNGVVF